MRWTPASLAEVQDHLEECRQRQFVDAAEFDRLWDIAEHAKATATRFMRPHEARARPRPGRSRR